MAQAPLYGHVLFAECITTSSALQTIHHVREEIPWQPGNVHADSARKGAANLRSVRNAEKKGSLSRQSDRNNP